MPFRPYHQLRNKVRLENVVSNLHDAGNVHQVVFENFQRYHPSLIYKLRSAKHNFELLSNKLATPDIREAINPSGNFMFEINMFIDGYFYAAGSSLDILARVVLTMFGVALPEKVYFQHAYDKLSVARPGDLILQRLTPPAWRDEFSNYRNTLTHELILANTIQLNLGYYGDEQTVSVNFPLPDDPRAKPADRTYHNNPDVLDYIKTNFIRILRIVNTVYGDIAERAEVIGHLPI